MKKEIQKTKHKKEWVAPKISHLSVSLTKAKQQPACAESGNGKWGTYNSGVGCS